MIRTIFLDFGNVLAHFDHWRAVNQLVRFTDMPGPDLYDLLYDGPLEDAYERGTIGTEEYTSEAIRRGRLTCTPEQFVAMFTDIFTPNREILDLIPKLAANHRLLLASNTNDAHYRHYLRQFDGAFQHFQATPTSHQAGHRKPEAGFFAYCQSFAEAEPGECLFVDDIAANVEAGRRHGWQAIQYLPGVALPIR